MNEQPENQPSIDKQPHICVRPHEISERIIVCGDPDRAVRIAALCDHSEPIAKNREFTLFNAMYGTHPVTICSTGIGAPSLLIALEELKNCGARYVIRVGSAGALQAHIKLGELIIAEGAVRDDGGSLAYLPKSYPAVADHALVDGLLTAAAETDTRTHLGLVRSHDSFYTDNEADICQYWQQRGILCADMETSALLAVGRYRGLKVASILNNVVLYQQDAQEGISQYTQSDAIMAQGETQASLIALQTLASQR